VDMWNYRSTDDDAASVTIEGPNVKIESPAQQAAPTSTGMTKTPGILLTLADIKKLPRREMITQFKCIEGWSQICQWEGARFSDFLKAYPPKRNPDGSLPKYAAMETTEGDFFSGYDMISLMHPQTLLCYAMAGVPLGMAHGAPLRLAMPLKYGYKQIKQIAKITYTNEKPPDYWATQGYDWYGGL
jgi:DMSO/TMAO reductase YedYZ molybdopterin-dependent catalytic subunit